MKSKKIAVFGSMVLASGILFNSQPILAEEIPFGESEEAQQEFQKLLKKPLLLQEELVSEQDTETVEEMEEAEDIEVIETIEEIENFVDVETLEPAEEEVLLSEEQEEEAPIVEPIVEEPVLEEPVVEEPMIEEPVVEEPNAEEVVMEQPTVEEPIMEEPIVEEPVVVEPIVEQPLVEQLLVPEVTPSIEVRDLMVLNDGLNQLWVSWTNPQEESFVKVNVYVNDTFYGETTADSIIISDLISDKEYTITAKTIDAEGNESEGVFVTARTKAEPKMELIESVNVVTIDLF